MKSVPEAKDVVALRLMHLDHLNTYAAEAQSVLDDLSVHGFVVVPKELLVRIKEHFQAGDPEKSPRFSHLNNEEIADILTAECQSAYVSGEQIYKDLCEVLK